MATHSSTLAWKIPQTEEPSGLKSMGSQRVGHDRATSLSIGTGGIHFIKLLFYFLQFACILLQWSLSNIEGCGENAPSPLYPNSNLILNSKYG